MESGWICEGRNDCFATYVQTRVRMHSAQRQAQLSSAESRNANSTKLSISSCKRVYTMENGPRVAGRIVVP